MKKYIYFACLLFVCPNSLFSINKSDFDITEQHGLLKTGVTQTIYNYGNHLYRAEKTELSLITGGYFTIGTYKGQSVSDFDDLCGITFGHPYAMTSYPVIGIDGNWGKFDELHSSLLDLSPLKNHDTLQVFFVHNNIAEVLFQMISLQKGETIKIVLKIKNIDSQKHTFGSGLILDPALGKWGDGRFYINHSLVEQEYLIEKSSINANLEIWERNSAAKGMGIKIDFNNKPDNVILDNWSNFYSGRKPEFGLLAEKIYDLAVKMLWEDTSVEPGQEISSETTVALVEPDFSAPVFISRDYPPQTGLSLINSDKTTLNVEMGSPHYFHVPDFHIIGNYPNPFNPVTTIKFLLSPNSVHVKTKLIKIFNSLGQLVAVIDISNMQPGLHEIRFNGQDFFGNPLPSGLYFVFLQVGEQISTIRMTLVK